LVNLVLSSISDQVVDLSNTTKPVPGYNGNTWILAQSIGFSLTKDQIQNAAVQAPNTSSILDPIRTSPNLTDFAVSIRGITTSSLASAQDTIKSASASSINLIVRLQAQCYSCARKRQG
jgi:hypothetical protein